MAVIPLPSTFHPDSFSMRLSTNQASFASPFGGSEQVADRLADRWLISLTLPPGTQANGAITESFIAGLRGMTNTVNLWHTMRPEPQGTMRGNPVCQGASPGVDTFVISTLPGKTLLAGDMIGTRGLLLQVRESATADGVGFLTVKVANRVRKQILAGDDIIWDRPTAPFRLTSTPSVQYLPGYADGVSLDFAEAIL